MVEKGSSKPSSQGSRGWIKTSLDHLQQQVIRNITQTIVTFFAGIVLFIAKAVFDWSDIKLEKDALSTKFLSFVHQKPFLFLFLLLLASWVIVLAFKAVRLAIRIIKENRRQAFILQSFGVETYWNVPEEHQKELAWECCKNAINHNGSLLCILGCTGWATFGREGAPLHDIIKMHQGPIQVLLIDHDSKYLVQRAESLAANINGYKKEITDSCEFLRQIKVKSNPRIELRLYNSQPPIWKMIISGPFLWLQYYNMAAMWMIPRYMAFGM